MSKCLCANPDKEEYLDFGDFEESNMEGSAACNTAEYFLATEWAGDKVIFVFEGEGESEFFPGENNVYHCVENRYSERSVLNSAPKYSHVVNTTLGEYYFKSALPKSEDGPYINPLPFILSEKGRTDLIGVTLGDKESDDIGRWVSGSILVTNNASICHGLKLFESPYVKENSCKNKLSGLNIVVTGTIWSLSRAEVEKLIRDHGGNPQKSVTKKTDFLVVGSKPGSKKIADAKKNGTKIIYEQDFFNMIGE